MMASYSDFLRSLANKLDKGGDRIEEGCHIKEICPDLLEIIMSEMTLDEVLKCVVSRYYQKVIVGEQE